MIDLALAPVGDALDLVLEDGDLRVENGLRTACYVSLFTDGLAAADDELPDTDGSRRGWWGSTVVAGDRPPSLGSKLWLLERSKLTQQTLLAAEAHASDALSWLVEARIAERVEVSASRTAEGALLLEVRLVRGLATERPELWQAELDAVVEVGPTRFRLVGVP